jgi:hypothetical protein
MEKELATALSELEAAEQTFEWAKRHHQEQSAMLLAQLRVDVEELARIQAQQARVLSKRGAVVKPSAPRTAMVSLSAAIERAEAAQKSADRVLRQLKQQR